MSLLDISSATLIAIWFLKLLINMNIAVIHNWVVYGSILSIISIIWLSRITDTFVPLVSIGVHIYFLQLSPQNIISVWLFLFGNWNIIDSCSRIS